MQGLKFAMGFLLPMLILLSGTLFGETGAQSPSQKEVDSLLAIKRGFGSPRTLASWNESGQGACISWVGVRCGAGGQVISLALPRRQLSGNLVDDIGNLTSLRRISIHDNAITGSLPQTLGNLPAMRSFAMFMNQFSGTIPANLGNSSALQALDVSFNYLRGEVPPGLTQSRRLVLIDFSYNTLWGGFPQDWLTSRSLLSIGLAWNYLSGTLPDQWGDVNVTSLATASFPSQLQDIDLRNNTFSGGIPPTFGALGNLTVLLLGSNNLSGEIPVQLGRLESLRALDLSSTGVTGMLPAELSALPLLRFADFGNNSLVGPLPEGLSGTNLSTLLVGNNKLNGSIPDDLGNVTHLTSLDLSSNQFTGSLPTSLGKLTDLTTLLVSHNALTGSIPSELGSVASLSALDLSFNNFSGSLPLSLVALTHLTSLNVSYNNLSGPIPPFPRAYNVSAFSGNPGLCGRPPFVICSAASSPTLSPALSPQAEGGKKHHRLSNVTIVFISLGSALGALAVICLCLLLLWRRKGESKNQVAAGGLGGATSHRSEKSLDLGGVDSEELCGKLVHFDGPMAFSADHLLCATAEVLGKSAYGTVYKATLEDGNIIAVKRLREGIVKGQKEFESEVGTIGKIRHPNLLALRAYYWGPKDEKLLVFDYVACGSLAAFLHARGPETPLPWETRMKIAIGAAKGLGYLHENENIVHGNVTASNILLDGRMNSRISDYGLSRLMTPQAMQGLMASAGTLGYRAPELSKTKKSTTKSDVYSFGIVLLELLTGKAPVEQSSSESGMDLAEWVSSVVKEEWTSEVFDVEIIKGAAHHQEDEMMNTLQLAMICVNTAPTSRPEMEDVIKQLEVIRPDLRSSPESGYSGPESIPKKE